ncbi:MAG: DUF465 domain-containing protein [Methylococcaceae bacterium]|nr:DUF465 domain-containing protein [Methylococcaceae bacterium]
MALVYCVIGAAHPTKPIASILADDIFNPKRAQLWNRMSDSPDQEQIRIQLHELETEHRDLDDIIIKLSGESYVNQFQIRRLKKRKLLLKDRIERLKSLLIPDLNA